MSISVQASFAPTLYASLMVHGPGNLYVEVDLIDGSAIRPWANPYWSHSTAIWALVEDPHTQGVYHMQHGDGTNWSDVSERKAWLPISRIKAIQTVTCHHCELTS